MLFKIPAVVGLSLVGCSLLASSSGAAVTYSAHDLYTLGIPSDAVSGAVYIASVGGGYAGGFASGNTYNQKAMYWSPASPGGIELDPASSTSSYVGDTDGNVQVGGVGVDSGYHAAMWFGSRESFMDLHPAGYTSSAVFGIGGGQQVGNASITTNHAMLWGGTSASAQDLHPAGYQESSARATDGQHQAGIARISNTTHAMTWSGSADSAVDLHPTGFTETFANAVSGPYQAGSGRLASSNEVHALLWNGTAESFIDLQPAGSDSSNVWGMNDVAQVGNTWLPENVARAALWFGSADSYIDLSALLPARFTDSYAGAIDADGTIYGIALDPSEARIHAIVWVVPEPTSFGVCAIVSCAGLLTRRRRPLPAG